MSTINSHRAQQISNAVYKRLVSERVAFQRQRRNEGMIKKTLGLVPHRVTVFGANAPTSQSICT